MVAGGLSLLFPTCYRKPLPNTIEEAENKRLIPLKQRYPSFRDLKNGKISSMTITANGLPNGINNSNVYTIPPTHYDKTQVKLAEQQEDLNNQNGFVENGNIYDQRFNKIIQRNDVSGNGSVALRPATFYNDDEESRLSDLEEELNETNSNNNWRLYSHEYILHPNSSSSQVQLRHNSINDSYDVNRSLRDLHVFSRPVTSVHQTKQQQTTALPNGYKGNRQGQRISETNL